MIGVQALKPEWIETLKDIQFIFPSAVIAGGCIRDMIYNKEVKDIDIFIQIDDVSAFDISKLEMALGQRLWPLSQTTEREEYQQFMNESDRQLIEIYQFDKGGVEHQLIFLKTDPDMVHKFDLSFCQVTYDAKNFVQATDAFKETFKTKVVTLGKDRPMTARIARRINKFKEKFPELTFPPIGDF